MRRAAHSSRSLAHAALTAELTGAGRRAVCEAPMPDRGSDRIHAPFRHRPRDRAPDPASGQAARARAALGPPRRAASGQEEGRAARAARQGHGRGAGDGRGLLDLRQHRYQRSLHHLRRSAPRGRHHRRGRGRRRPLGAGARRRAQRPLPRARRRAVAARWRRPGRSRHRPAGRPRRRRRRRAR